MAIYIQFTDSTDTVIAAAFGGPQDATAYPNQGTVLASDARWAAFYATISPLAQALFPAPPTPLAPSAAQTAQAAYAALIAGGVTVISTSTPSLNGVYPIDANTQVDITTEASFITSFAEFTTGGTANLPWQLANGTFVEWPTTASFLAFAKAVGQLVAAAKLAAAQAAAMPSPAVTIP